MPTYRVIYRTGGRYLLEDVEADAYRRQSGWHVLTRDVLVVGQPREVVVLRVADREVYDVQAGSRDRRNRRPSPHR